MKLLASYQNPPTDSARSRRTGCLSIANPLQFAKSCRLPEEPFDDGTQVEGQGVQQQNERSHVCARP